MSVEPAYLAGSQFILSVLPPIQPNQGIDNTRAQPDGPWPNMVCLNEQRPRSKDVEKTTWT